MSQTFLSLRFQYNKTFVNDIDDDISDLYDI